MTDLVLQANVQGVLEVEVDFSNLARAQEILKYRRALIERQGDVALQKDVADQFRAQKARYEQQAKEFEKQQKERGTDDNSHIELALAKAKVSETNAEICEQRAIQARMDMQFMIVSLRKLLEGAPYGQPGRQISPL
jgi:hypothetical protein